MALGQAGHALGTGRGWSITGHIWGLLFVQDEDTPGRLSELADLETRPCK